VHLFLWHKVPRSSLQLDFLTYHGHINYITLIQIQKKYRTVSCLKARCSAECENVIACRNYNSIVIVIREEKIAVYIVTV